MQESSSLYSTARLIQSCFAALEKLPEQLHYNDEEQALFDRLHKLHDPLLWEEQPRDGDIAETLWCKMASLETQQIQSSAIVFSLERMEPIMSLPPGGFI